MMWIIDAFLTMGSVGAVCYTVGAAKAVIDRHPQLKELGWNGAIMWPFVLGLMGAHKMVESGYKLGQTLPAWDPANALPPPTANALNPGREG